ncbi:MAG: MFS transporter [Alphaproteobacteria bacterium]|nr:MFS transporter [Alphaproteobacteria bacterium]
MPRRARTAAPRRLLARRSFRRAWAAGALAGAMRWLEMLAVGWFVIEQTGSPLAVSLVLFLRQAPMLLFGAFAGALSERGDRRLILLAAMIAMTVVMAALSILSFTGTLTVWHAAAGVVVSGVFWALDFPVRRTMLGDLAGPPHFGTAMALDSSTASFTRMLGPLAGGALMDTVGIGGAYLAGTLGFGGGALLLLSVSYRRPLAPPTGRGFLADIRDAFAYLPHAPVMLGTVLLTVVMNIFGFPYLSMIPVIGKGNLELNALSTGSLMSAEAAIAFVTALVIAALIRPVHFLRLYVVAGAAFLACIIGFSLAPGYPQAMTALLASGIGFAGFASMQGALILHGAAPAMRARIMGMMTVAIGAGGPVGTLHVGFMAEHLGAQAAVGVMAAEGLACMALALLVIPALRPWRAPPAP